MLAAEAALVAAIAAALVGAAAAAAAIVLIVEPGAHAFARPLEQPAAAPLSPPPLPARALLPHHSLPDASRGRRRRSVGRDRRRPRRSSSSAHGRPRARRADRRHSGRKP
jgi:hypothetical protein